MFSGHKGLPIPEAFNLLYKQAMNNIAVHRRRQGIGVIMKMAGAIFGNNAGKPAP
jgi:hypothetical protein